MLQKFQRPLTENERRRLEHVPAGGNLSSTLGWFGLWTAVLAVCLFVFVKALSREGGPTGVWIALIPFVFIVGILAFYAAYMVVSGHLRLSGCRRQFVREWAPKIRAALEHGGASVCSVTSDRVIMIKEFEDEGSAYIYDLGDGTSFFLRGDDYFPEGPEGTNDQWPAKRFEIVRMAANDLLVGVYGASERLEPVQTVPMNEMPESFCFADEPRTETVLPGRPEEILKRLGHQPAVEKD